MRSSDNNSLRIDDSDTTILENATIKKRSKTLIKVHKKIIPKVKN
jgi:hypothetical protein